MFGIFAILVGILSYVMAPFVGFMIILGVLAHLFGCD